MSSCLFPSGVDPAICWWKSFNLSIFWRCQLLQFFITDRGLLYNGEKSNLHQLCYWRTSRKGLFVTTAEVSAKCRWNVSDMSVICWWSNDWLSTEYRLTIDRLLSETDYWPHINRYSTDTRLVLDRQMTRTRSILNWQSTNTRPIYWLICQPRVNQHISPPLIRHKIHFFQVAHLLYLHKCCVEWKSCNSVL